MESHLVKDGTSHDASYWMPDKNEVAVINKV
jgi:hypothetical protein